MSHVPHPATFTRNAIVASLTLIIGGIWCAHTISTFPEIADSLQTSANKSFDAVNKNLSDITSIPKEIAAQKAADATATALTPEQLERIQTEITAAQPPAKPGLPEVPSTDAPIAVVTDPVKIACTHAGGVVRERKTYRVCVFFDGTECEAQALSDNTCHDGQYVHAEMAPNFLK